MTWASTPCTSTCTRRSPRRTAAADPGAGPWRSPTALAPFLPGPVVGRPRTGVFTLDTPERSIGRVRSFFGNFGVLVRAYAYIRALGRTG